MPFAHIIAVIGARPGVGCSTIALNLAFALAQQRKQAVLLVDADLPAQGDLAAMTAGTWTRLDEIREQHDKKIPPSLLPGFISHHEQGISYLQLFGMAEAATVASDPQQYSDSLAYLSAGFPCLIVDCGAVLHPLHAPWLFAACDLLLVATPQPGSMNAAQQQRQRLEQAYLPAEKIHHVVNLWSEQGALRPALFADYLNSKHVFCLAVDAPAMERALVKHEPAWLQARHGGFSKSLQRALEQGLVALQGQDIVSDDFKVGKVEALCAPWLAALTPTHQPTALPSPSAAPSLTAAVPAAIAKWGQEDEAWRELKQQILSRLFQVIDLKKVAIHSARDAAQHTKLRAEVSEAILKIINELGEEQVPAAARKSLIQDVLNEAIGLGPLETLLADPSISEVMINGRKQIYIESKGRLQLTGMEFIDEAQLGRIIERIVAPIGRRVDESTPLVDARLPDGSRVNIIIPPLALKGATVTIRRFSEKPLQVSDLIGFGALTSGMAEFLRACIEARLNVIISGGTGSGKTTLLNVLSSFIPDGERIVTIEDAAELKLHQRHVVTLEARPANLEGKGEITIRDLVKNSLRMRPDRIVVGECRGGEALDMLQAMNTGHDGSMTTVHANTTKDAVGRLETLVMFSGIQLPARAIREQIAGAIQVLVQLSRLSDGSRKITDIAELTGMEGDVMTMQSIFRFEQRGVDAAGKVQGQFAPSGFIPKFYDQLKHRGIELSREIFLGKGRELI